ncbi:hypothetical protein D043_0482A, partial [Vibrio parahaemolyticus EKP-021]
MFLRFQMNKTSFSL